MTKMLYICSTRKRTAIKIRYILCTTLSYFMYIIQTNDVGCLLKCCTSLIKHKRMFQYNQKEL